jgi:SLBB domain-containing protein
MDVRRNFSIVFVILFICSQAFSQNRTYLSNSTSDDVYKNRISEYFYNKTGAEVLRSIKLLGLVNRPGIYHVPDNTSLTTLLSIAGGTDHGADLKEITISNPDGTSVKMDLSQQLSTGKDFNLKPNDIIYIPEKKSTFDRDATNTVVVVSTIVSLLLTTYVVFRPPQNR